MVNDEVCCCGINNTEDDLYPVLEDILEDYAGKPGSLIPVLQLAQKLFGYLPEKALKLISLKLNKSYSEVAGVVSFYSFFTTFPRGKFLIRVCLGTACYVRGGKSLLNSLQKELKIDIGQTTPDRLFSLDVGRCFGACGLAPVIMINDDVHQRVKPEAISKLILEYRNKENELIQEHS